MKKKRKNKQMDQRTKIVFFFVLVFVIAMSVSYLGLYRQSRELKKEEKQVEADIRDAKKEKKELKDKKEYVKTKEFIEKMATEKFGLLYPGEYLLKADEEE
ncbi:MAG TPA: septum formation initiator family protein [Candidatus Anaerostipes excrementavium]|uniref:Septum formation initiator family protein n=1 Tax=Candidatus Anaerostipes excrementavium TaxID=2838463 RepID=A0A9D2B8Y8_9FIRM|nr:septum formation initiator family protein [uncultured Anaerostipes sp.]HIX67690.1 septum formation initiator family protein [Candidatus Anaerostipes excrementavium]